MEKTGYAEYMYYVENQEIDNAIFTLEHIQDSKEQDDENEQKSSVE